MKAMASLSNFFTKHEAIISALRYIIIPIVIAACLFYLDQRYVQRDAWATNATEIKLTVEKANVEQRQSMARLADAITALTNEQRNVAELQRSNTAQIKSVSDIIKEYQNTQADAWRKSERRIERLEELIAQMNTTIVRHDTILNSGKR